MAPKRAMRSNIAPETTNTTSVTNAQLQAMINQGVTAALAARDANTNGIDNHNSGTGARINERATRKCTYPDFIKCQPLNFKGIEDIIELTRWIKKMETVFRISNYFVENQIKFSTCTLLGNALTWWNSHVRTVGNDIAYAMTWTKLKKKIIDMYCPRTEIKKLKVELMFLEESDKIEKYVLLERIISSLHQEFPMTDLGSLNYFLGIFVAEDSSGMFLFQRKYAAEILEGAYMENLQQPKLSHSSAKAEYRGVVNVVDETCWLRNLLCELHTPLSSAMLVYYDNVSAVYLSSNPIQHQRTKHIKINIHFVRDLVDAGQVRVFHVPTCYQYADIFIKGLPSDCITSLKCVLTQEHLDAICAKYFVPEEVHPQLPSPDATRHERLAEMDLNAFIRTADPRKVRIVKRARAENERPIITVAKHRTVTLLSTSVVRPSGELSASVEREFVRDASINGGGDEGVASVGGLDNVEPIVPITDNVETKIPGPKRTKKKRVIHGSERTLAASHPPKRLRADYGTTGSSATGEQGVPALPTLPFITSSVTASPLEEGGDHTNSVTGPSLRTVGPSARFVVLSDSSHHSGAKSADPEVDSLIRSAVPEMTEATTVTTIAPTVVIPADVGKDKSAPHPSVFGSSSSSEKTDRTLSLFTRRSGSGFAARSIHVEEVTDVGLEEIYVPEWTVTKGFELNDRRFCANMINHFTPPAFFKTVRGMEHEQLFAEFNVSAARNLSLSSEVRMHAEYNILEKRKWRSLAEEKDSLLGAKDKEIEELRSQLLKAKEESVAVTQLRARVSSLEAIEGSLRGEVASAKEHNGLLEQECGSLKLKVTSLESIIAEKDRELSDLGASSSSLRSQNQSLVNQVHELETSSMDLREKLEIYEGSMKRLEEFQDNLMRPFETRWLLTHGMKLLMAKCLNSIEYIEALRNAFGRAIKKGMQEGLAAGIEHGQAGRCLTDLEAYIPSVEDDFNSAVCDLRGLNFLLLQELSNKKDAST
ncbi:gypsy type transposase [Tanacetum coccineum]|uniref:Gypsy type transposase n=1 Tax=Tanacetum coccineum TaxID=301880 RepID=A0ABQ4WKY6_9ASTR